MSTRKLLVLTGVFLALLAFVVFFERKQPTSEDRAKAARRLAQFKPEEVVSVTIERPDLPKVDLARREKGRWLVLNPPASAADGFSADNLIGDLARLEVVGDTRTAFDPKEFGLDAPKAKATLAFADKSSKVFSFGAPIPGTDAVAAAEGKLFGAVRSAPLAALTKPVDEYRSRQLFDVPVGEITRVSVTRGPNSVVVSRTVQGGAAPGAWRLEKPVADLASESFVDRFLGDLAGVRISEFASVPEADLARVGLAPPVVTVVLEKGPEKVATIGFGAAKAEAAGGRMYARVGVLVVVIDDRVREDLDKELSAYRESRVAPVDTFTLRRISFAADDLRAGADKVDGQWRSAGRPVAALHAEGLAAVLARAEGRGFIPAKPGKVAPEKSLATVEVVGEAEGTTRNATFYAAPAGSPPDLVAVDVTGRPERILVDKAILDEIRREAAALRNEADGKPKDAKGRAPAKPEPTRAPGRPVKAAPPR
ncbi:MAG: DUF4340 domain-containing protein [Thermoanaerobaculia bacterium]|jgi:hypothetical protein